MVPRCNHKKQIPPKHCMIEQGSRTSLFYYPNTPVGIPGGFPIHFKTLVSLPANGHQ
jgi:hypothetical protein